MWNGIPRVLRVRLYAVAATVVLLLPIKTGSVDRLASPQSVNSTIPAVASCDDVVINEVLFRPANPPNDEWVELYVVNAIAVGTILKISDLEIGSGRFQLEFILSAGVPGNRYIVVHGNDLPESQEPDIGYVNFFNAGNGARLANGGDNVVLSINGAECEEVHWGSVKTPASEAPVTRAFGSTSSINSGESIQRLPNGLEGQFVRGTTSGLYNAIEGNSIGRNNDDGTLAVTVSWFHSRRAGDMTEFAWQTATETGNAGFNLLAVTGDSAAQLNPTLIPSTVIDSITPTDYGYIASTQADRFYLQEVRIDGLAENTGPFALGETHGVRAMGAADSAQEQTDVRLYLPLIRR